MTPPEPGPRNAPPAQSEAVTRFTRAADRVVLWIARHWLALFNGAFGLYVLLPLLAPILLQANLPTLARPLYALYSVTCHQIPDHSYFLFGPTLVPSRDQLIVAGMSDSPNLLDQRVFRGNEAIGYKVALCQRDVAIYGSIFVGGLLYGLFGRRMRPIPFKVLLLAMVPLALDGGTQLLGLRESNWLLRTVTGALFGLAGLLWIYPYVDAAMRDTWQSESARSVDAPFPSSLAPGPPKN